MHYQPDHDQPRFGDFGAAAPPGRVEATRLSLLAIASLVTGVLSLVGCCVPAVGLLPAGLGLGSLVVIRHSGGAVVGRGMALAGLLMGIGALIVSTGLWIGASSMGSQFGPVYNQVLDKDPAVVRSVLSAEAAAGVTDEQIAAFQAALEAEHPGGARIPEGILSLWMGFGRTGGDPNEYRGVRDPTEGAVFPLPAGSGRDWFYLIVLMSVEEQIGSGFPPIPAAADVGFERADGTVVWLLHEPTPIGVDSQSPPGGPTDERPGSPTPEPEGDPGG